MDYRSGNLDNLFTWFHTFDPGVLQNEDDVETKFVMPMFEHLGYTAHYRRGKFPINAYNPNRSGRKPEADNVYFSSDETSKQNENTALILIEAKEPNKQNLEEDIKQAQFYSEYLKPLFYVITNGSRILINKRHRHRGDECLFDVFIDTFMDIDNVTKLYKQLNFNIVKELKESAIDDVTNALYTEITQLLKQKPDLLAQIEKGDFKEHTLEDRQGQKITISRPKVALECDLPLVLRGGSCRIEFSNVMLRGLTCQLTHEDIVQNLLIGLNSQPHWNTRPFIHQSPAGIFIAKLGKTTVLLSEQEAQDLCACIDFIGERYKQTISTSETLLESWDYKFTQTYEIPGYESFIRGFSLLSVKPWLWQLMRQFARSFDYVKGDTAWHIFDARLHSIRIHVDKRSWTNVVLWAIAEETGDSPDNEWLSILYYDPDEELEFYDASHEDNWKAYVGPQGVWTVQYTQEWIVNQFIPKVISYYNLHKSHLGETQSPFLMFQEWLTETVAPKVFAEYQKQRNQERQKKLDEFLKDSIDVYKSKEDGSFSEVKEFKQLEPYLHHIQGMLIGYPTHKIEAISLQNYYSVFAEIARLIDPSTVDVGYAYGKLKVAERDQLRELSHPERQPETRDTGQELSDYDWILHCLDEHAKRLQSADYEDTGVAELISRALIAITEGCNNYISQRHINQAIEAIKPLWEHYRFYTRHIRLFS